MGMNWTMKCARRCWPQSVALLILLSCGAGFAHAIPAFARKTGLRCSACHEAWPKLNSFGQTYKDNGYQIGNDRDAPVYLSPLYWPISLRISPAWHNERNSAEATDQSAGGVQPVSTQGFDLSGMDLLALGLLHKNISFALVPSSDNYANFQFESAWVRFDNLLNSSWLNAKMGKFELDSPVSEKRILTLSQNGGYYQINHYLPNLDGGALARAIQAPGEQGASTTAFGLGDNQLGVEVMGHSRNNYSRYSASVLSSSDGSVNLPTSNGYDMFLAGSQAFDAGELGLQRIGGFSYIGQAPTRFLTQTAGALSSIIPGSGYGNKIFTRTGAYGMLSAKRLALTPMFTHATESGYIALGIPSNNLLPTGTNNPTWNGRMLEANYTVNLQLVLTARYEDIRNTTQTLAASKSSFGDLDAETVALRWYPFMTSRDGLAFHAEYSKVHQVGVSAIGSNQTLRSGYVGLDFAF
jgi:hypothetical protein